MIRVREFDACDGDQLLALFRAAILDGAAGDYSVAQRRAWADLALAVDWAARLGQNITLVAERDGKIAGFMTMGRDGHLDLAFVHPDAMGQGVASALYDRLIHIARTLDLDTLVTEASFQAKRFLSRKGWVNEGAQLVTLGAVELMNFRMRRDLARDVDRNSQADLRTDPS